MTSPNPGPQYGQSPQSGWGPMPPIPPAPPTAPKPRGSRRVWIIYGAIALVSLFVGVGIGAGGDSGAADGSADEVNSKPGPTVTVTETAAAEAAEPGPTVTETVTAKPKETKEAGPATSFAGEGEYLVGEDIKAGTYKSAGPEDEFGCYWERTKDASGEFGSIIANNNLDGPGRVTLNNGEYFKTNRCQEWKRVG
ncbi:hypothetical protein ACFVYG_27630 [Streptomyces sp. NPDC058256]|uniref:hypothetical protein n=1 Tax=Streptomyces sp. NPDC058256 TaxID=3346408 RepID=UPI0036EF683A